MLSDVLMPKHTTSNLILYVCAAVNALKLVALGHESVKRRTCVSAEDCGTEVLTRQQQRLGWGGGRMRKMNGCRAEMER